MIDTTGRTAILERIARRADMLLAGGEFQREDAEGGKVTVFVTSVELRDNLADAFGDLAFWEGENDIPESDRLT